MWIEWFINCSMRKIKAIFQIFVDLTVPTELVRNNSMTPEHALPVRALGNKVVLPKYSLASEE
jgi:hypothetical protein